MFLQTLIKYFNDSMSNFTFNVTADHILGICWVFSCRCMQSMFIVPTGSIRTDVETGVNADRVATEIPPHILDTSIKVIKIDGVTVSVSKSPVSLSLLIVTATQYFSAWLFYVCSQQ